MPALQRRTSRWGRVVRRVAAVEETEVREARSQGRKVMGREGETDWMVEMVVAAEAVLRPVKRRCAGL